MTFTNVRDLRNWVDNATSNWDNRTDEQIDALVTLIRNDATFPAWGRNADEYLESMPENLADLREAIYLMEKH